MRNNAAYLPENPIVYIIFPESIHNRASFTIFAKLINCTQETNVSTENNRKNMKLSEWFKARSGQELMMIAVVAMLLVMIATRWAYISRTAKEAIRQRFVPPAEQADSLQAK